MSGNNKEVAMSAAFMGMGYATACVNYQAESGGAPTTKGWGQIESVAVLVEWAERLELLYTAIPEDAHDFSSGVWDYDVAEPMGVWFGKQVSNGEIPSKKELDAYMIEIVADFFAEGEDGRRSKVKRLLLKTFAESSGARPKTTQDAEQNAPKATHEEALITAIEDLQRELHANFKMNVRKHYSLMVADSVASKVVFNARAAHQEADQAAPVSSERIADQEEEFAAEASVAQEMFEAKSRLYGLLLQKGGANWTDAEIDIAFHLSMDPQIQAHLLASFKHSAALVA